MTISQRLFFFRIFGASYVSAGFLRSPPIICHFSLLKTPSFWCSWWMWYSTLLVPSTFFSVRMGRQVWPIYSSTKSLMRNIKEFRCARFKCQWAMFFSSFFFILHSFFFFKSGNSQILAKFTIPVLGHYSFSHKALSLLNKRGAIRPRLWLSESEATSVKAIFSWQIFMDLRIQLKAKTNFLILHEEVLVIGSKEACIWLLSRRTVWKWLNIPNFT